MQNIYAGQTPTPAQDTNDVGTSVVQAMPPVQNARKGSSPNTSARGLASKKKKNNSLKR
jgi:hypothetical protein